MDASNRLVWLRWCIVMMTGLCGLVAIVASVTAARMHYISINDAFIIIGAIGWIGSLLFCICLALEGTRWLARVVIKKLRELGW